VAARDQADATQQGRNDLVWFFHAMHTQSVSTQKALRRHFVFSRSHLVCIKSAPVQDRCSARMAITAFYNEVDLMGGTELFLIIGLSQTAHDCQYTHLVDRWGPHNSSQHLQQAPWRNISAGATVIRFLTTSAVVRSAST
jgi:hypothetical protein